MPEFFLLLRRAFYNAMMDGCFGLAKAAAYSGLLSLFPLLSSLAAILVQANAEAVSEYLVRFLLQVVPPGTADMVRYQFTARGQRPFWLIIGATLLSVWAAASLMESLMEGFRAAYRLPTGRGIVRDRLVAMVLVFVAAVPAVAASMVILFGSRLQSYLFPSTGLFQTLGRSLTFAVSFCSVVLVVALLYFIGPNRPMRWRDVWPGAWIASTLWFTVTLIFSWYVQNLANYNLMYGTVGGVIAMLVWMYLLAAIALFGCEYNAERERLAQAR
jgi:membrane protein